MMLKMGGIMLLRVLMEFFVYKLKNLDGFKKQLVDDYDELEPGIYWLPKFEETLCDWEWEHWCWLSVWNYEFITTLRFLKSLGFADVRSSKECPECQEAWREVHQIGVCPSCGLTTDDLGMDQYNPWGGICIRWRVK